jgi:hypothetical protein
MAWRYDRVVYFLDGHTCNKEVSVGGPCVSNTSKKILKFVKLKCITIIVLPAQSLISVECLCTYRRSTMIKVNYEC